MPERKETRKQQCACLSDVREFYYVSDQDLSAIVSRADKSCGKAFDKGDMKADSMAGAVDFVKKNVGSIYYVYVFKWVATVKSVAAPPEIIEEQD